MAKPSCLVVEDEPGIGWAIRRLLEQAGVDVMVAGNAVRAVRHLAEDQVSAIFLDLKLPDADGFELAGVMNQMAPGIPIIIISAYFYPNDPKVQQMLDRGIARRFIAKPFRHAELLYALRGLLPGHDAGSAIHSQRSITSGIPSGAAIRRRENLSVVSQ